jgi:hypothetical protein
MPVVVNASKFAPVAPGDSCAPGMCFHSRRGFLGGLSARAYSADLQNSINRAAALKLFPRFA